MIPKKVVEIIKILNSNDKSAYLVGGCVRDMIIGDTPHDWDICTEATPTEVKHIMTKHKIATFESGIEFGTITAIIDNEQFEITTYRKETQYTDNRRPEKVEFIRDINEDLKRRDFSINAMAFNPLTKELIDNFNGIEDIKTKTLRCVGDASERIEEDALRILRALRFAIKYGYSIDDDTVEAINKNCKLLNNISKERITQELEKILTCNKPVKNIFMQFSNVVETIIPEIKTCIGFDQKSKYHTHTVYEHMLYVVDYCNTTDFSIKLSALLHDIGKPVAFFIDDNGQGHFHGHPKISKDIAVDLLKKDFRLDAKTYDEVLILIENHDILVASTKASVKRALNKFGKELLDKYLILKQADIDDHINLEGKKSITQCAEVKELEQEILQEAECFNIKDLNINGLDIMKVTGCKPGKVVGAILSQLLQEVIDDKLVNNKEELENRVLELYKEYN